MTPDYTPILPGDVIDSWCSKCGHATPHVYQPAATVKLLCQACQACQAGKEERR